MLRLIALLLACIALTPLAWRIPYADAQGVGLFQTYTTGTRTKCTDITSPVSGQTFCLDQSRNTLNGYDGTGWQSDAALALGGGNSGAFVNVRDPRWGAKGDGTTDDTTAIQNAINAVPTSGGIVYFPPHNAGQFYKTTATITVTASNITLMGAGINASVVIGSANNITTLSITGNNVTVRDMSWQHNAAGGFTRTSNANIAFGSSAGGYVKAVFVAGAFRGITLTDATDTEVTECLVENQSDAAIFVTTVTANRPLQDAITLCRIFPSVKYGVVVGDATHSPRQVRIENNHLIQVGQDGIILYGSEHIVLGNELHDPGNSAANTYDAITVQGSYDTIVGNTLHADTIGAAKARYFVNFAAGSRTVVAGNSVENGTATGTFGGTLTNQVIYDGTFVAVGTNAARTGALRIPNNTSLYGRNAANGADVALIGVDTTNQVNIGNGSGNILLNDTFIRLTGTGAGTPALKRNGTAIEFRLGDDSAFAPGHVLSLQVGAAPTGGDPGAGGINISLADGFQVNGTALKNITETLSNKTLTAPIIGTSTFASLPASPNGTIIYCSDCTAASALDQTCAGAGTGNLAARVNGAWKCAY